jgi:hypothetical protein
MIEKKRFAFDKTEGYVDLYLNDKKIINKHRGETGNYYFRVEDAMKFDVATHDSTIPVEANIVDGKLEPVKREPRFVTTDEKRYYVK